MRGRAHARKKYKYECKQGGVSLLRWRITEDITLLGVVRLDDKMSMRVEYSVRACVAQWMGLSRHQPKAIHIRAPTHTRPLTITWTTGMLLPILRMPWTHQNGSHQASHATTCGIPCTGARARMTPTTDAPTAAGSCVAVCWPDSWPDKGRTLPLSF